MKYADYQKIVETYRQLKKRDCLGELAALFPDVLYITLESIVFQECQRKTKKTYYLHYSVHNQKIYYDRLMNVSKEKWNQHSSLLKISDKVGLSPALMAKFILEYHYNVNENKNPEIKKTKVKVNEMLKDVSLIDDPFLAAEVKTCVLADQAYGPVSDIIRNSIGQEYESKLKNELTELGIIYTDERQLRDRGYDKTPDIKLDIPIIIESQIVNWIESKASFGDVERHKEYLRDQYWSYCNRFGPGLVIYWAGYIDELNINKDQGIMISDKLPTDIMYMEPTSLIKDKNLN